MEVGVLMKLVKSVQVCRDTIHFIGYIESKELRYSNLTSDRSSSWIDNSQKNIVNSSPVRGLILLVVKRQKLQWRLFLKIMNITAIRYFGCLNSPLTALKSLIISRRMNQTSHFVDELTYVLYGICHFHTNVIIRQSRNQQTLSILTSPKELNQMLIEHEDLLLVDTRSFGEYSKGHIQGAINIDLFQFHWIDSSKLGIRQFVHQSRNCFSNIGVSDKKSIVFYDNLSGMSTARGVWLLLYFSHKKVSLLDGGFINGKKR